MGHRPTEDVQCQMRCAGACEAVGHQWVAAWLGRRIWLVYAYGHHANASNRFCVRGALTPYYRRGFRGRQIMSKW